VWHQTNSARAKATRFVDEATHALWLTSGGIEVREPVYSLRRPHFLEKVTLAARSTSYGIEVRRSAISFVQQDYIWDRSWRLLTGFVVEYLIGTEYTIARPHWEGINEYGEGETEEEALIDLLRSLTGYLEILQEHQDWDSTEQSELKSLLRLIGRKT
jgi:predicted RNase H-like HicB family nuclease